MRRVLRKDLSYQEQEAFMMHDASVAALHVNRDASLLAAGDSAGVLKVLDLESGQCMRRIQAHQAGVTAVMMHRDNHQVLSTSFDGLARIHGLKSGQLVKEYAGHESYVNQGKFSPDHAQVVTVSSDGHVRMFDARTAELLHKVAPPTPAHLNSALQLAVLALEWAPSTGPGGEPTLYVLTKSNTIFHMTLKGEVLKTYSTGKGNKDGGDFVAMTLSPQGKWLLGVAEDRHVYAFSATEGKLSGRMDLGLSRPTEVTDLTWHPSQNTVAVCCTDGSLSILEP